MANRSTFEAQRRRALDYGYTSHPKAFAENCRRADRINMIIEGDSWFAYPPHYVLSGPASNAIDMLRQSWAHTQKTNALCLALNGDTAKRMFSGSQFRTLKRVVKKSGDKLDLLLLSAGGNDIVGKNSSDRSYLLPIIKNYTNQSQAAECVNEDVLSAKLQQIMANFSKVIALRDRYAPQAHIVTHTYDYLMPCNRPAVFLKGWVTLGPWIFPAMQERGIPESMRLELIKYMLEKFNRELEGLTQVSQKFHVANTQGCLVPGDDTQWIDEIHPTPPGFHAIASRIDAVLQPLFADLPAIAPLAEIA